MGTGHARPFFASGLTAGGALALDPNREGWWSPLSRRQQQRKRRQRQFDPLKAAGYDNRPHRHGLMWRLLHNQWIVFAGLAVIAVATVFSTCLATNTGNQQNPSDTRVFETATPEPSVTPTTDPNASVTPAPTATATPAQRRFAAAEQVVDPDKQYTATIKTEKGDIMVALDAKQAPQAVNMFVFLAKQGYYNGLTFNRVIPDFVAQGGDAGAGSPGFGIAVEQNELKHDAFSMAMARSNTTGQLTGQFYISLAPQPTLDGRDTVFGRVVSGQDVARQLTPRNPERNPTAPPGDKIVSVTISESPAS